MRLARGFCFSQCYSTGMLPVDHLEFGMARRVSRAYNEYRKGMGMNYRSEQEQKRLEDEVVRRITQILASFLLSVRSYYSTH